MFSFGNQPNALYPIVTGVLFVVISYYYSFEMDIFCCWFYGEFLVRTFIETLMTWQKVEIFHFRQKINKKHVPEIRKCRITSMISFARNANKAKQNIAQKYTA